MIRPPAPVVPSRILPVFGAALVTALALAASIPEARAFTYTSGDILYVAYQSPNGPNYIVDLGPQSLFVSATTELTFPNVLPSDLNGVVGGSAPDIFVGLFGVLNPSTRDGILSANGPDSDARLAGANILGAVNQTDSFGNGVALYASPVPSATPSAGSFASGGATGSYQSTLDAVTAGSLGNNLDWTVETQLSDDAGGRNAGPVVIPFYKAIRNPFTGTSSRAVIGFFSLNPDGSIAFLPDTDGDSFPNNQDCNPTDATVWALPGEVPSMTFASGGVNFSWTTPAQLGGTGVLYDVFRISINSPGVAPSYACLQPDLAGPTSSDSSTPPVGRVFLYLVAAGDSCGEGVAGTRSNGQPIAVPACP
jgi:hypothetical protein